MANGEIPVKPGWQTTEFWVTIFIQAIGIAALVYPGFITPERSSVLMDAVMQLGAIVSMVAAAFGYSLSRGMAKKKQ
jgi:hypothetical protein